MKVRISSSAYQSGYGKDRWKKVLGLTPAEKNWVLHGYDDSYLCFKSDRLSGGNHGTRWRYAEQRWAGQYWNPRVPPVLVIGWLSQMTAKVPIISQVEICKNKRGYHGFVVTYEDGRKYRRHQIHWNENDAIINLCGYLLYHNLD